MTLSDTVVNPADPKLLLAELEAAGERLAAARAGLGRIIFGQRQVIDLSLITLLSGGHA
ncbi:MAG: AAA family ATPase, partial [Alphaproteobacteria bacterium]|nr:AAA family ATPase [Alphaproteobacteria bacterium]